ncbi:MAG: hypothetical protein R3284_02500 [Rubricoccaceae bacterium]|nr:hypothetical protein [Rubricoccaceae bacterium]
MTAKLFTAALSVALLLPLTVSAQDGYPTMGVSHWKCDFSYVGDLVQEMNDVGLPIAQEMVDDGTIVNWGMMTHLFGDEWNVLFYVATPPGAPFIERATELQSAQLGALGDESNARFVEHCTEHKDSIYTWNFSTQGGTPGDNTTMALSFWKCNFGALGSLMNAVEETGLPVAQEMVDDGDIFAWGAMTHNWGDEWNVMFYSATPDESSFMDATSELQSRQFQAYGEELINEFGASCWGHRDSIYSMRLFTSPSGE